MQSNESLETLADTGILRREPPVPDEINRAGTPRPRQNVERRLANLKRTALYEA